MTAITWSAILTRMPRKDLRQDQTDLHPLAPFQVLAVMCHPADPWAQKAMIAKFEVETGAGQAKRPKRSDNDVKQQVTEMAHRGNVAGDVLLYLIQLNAHHPPASVNKAAFLVDAALPPWKQPGDHAWRDRQDLDHTSLHRPRMLDAIRDFLPVSHLWAALILGQLTEDRFGPNSNETMVQFLGTAMALAKHGAGILWRGKDRRVVLPSDVIWRFTLPRTLRQNLNVTIPPLNPSQLEVLQTYRNP